MKLYVAAAYLATALLRQAQVVAQTPDLSVKVVTPGYDKWAHLLDLSTSLDTADLTRHATPPLMQAKVGPPRYDYRNSRKVERRYNRVRRYYRRQGRRDHRAVQKQSHRSYMLQRRQILRNEKQRKKELSKLPAEAEQKPRSRQ